MVAKHTVSSSTFWRERAHALAPGINLPTPPGELIGRENERAQAAATLSQSPARLLTLYGPGGVGKTRLALAVAADLIGHFPDGVFFVPLDGIVDGGLFLSAISQSLELYTLPNETILPTLVGYMRDMQALIVLDNFEQITSAAPILAALMSQCPRLKALVTSRNLLNLRLEQEMEVQPLLLPRSGSTALSSIKSSPIVELFVQRARLVKPDFALSEENAPTVAEICTRLDGLPLAVELAAARSKLLTPKALLARLKSGLRLLTGGAQDLPPRQQTLNNAIEWSYDLLTPGEQAIFRALSVFVGGCTLEAAEVVCQQAFSSESPNLDILEITTSLTNKSLLRVIQNDDEVRVQMLETIREYALERLHEDDAEAGAAAEAHAHWILRLAEEAETGLRGPQQTQWLDKLEREMGNIRAAIEWCIAGDLPSQADIGLRVAASLNRFWQVRSHMQEGLRWLDTLLERTAGERTIARAQALCTAAHMSNALRHSNTGSSQYETALSIAREQGDQFVVTRALNGLATGLYLAGNQAGALAAYEECLQIWTRMGSKTGIAGALNNVGIMHDNMGNKAAIQYLEKSVQAYRELGDAGRLGVTLGSLGRSRLHANDIQGANRDIHEGIGIMQKVGDQWAIAYLIALLAEVEAALKSYRKAALLFAAAEAAYDGFSDRLDQFDRRAMDLQIDRLRRVLGEVTFEQVWAEGTQLTPAEAITHAEVQGQSLAYNEPNQPAGSTIPTGAWKNAEGLSEREIEVLRLLAQRLSSSEIAEKLVLSLYTINAHLRNIYSKLNVSSRSGARRYAIENGLI